ncbi:MAG: cyclic nucleotide-binding domain-containing protein, partial [Cyanothece sp. SIO1E1]|nr:cyclic nucleotide-binding domain-containing protein [Cyanothece sp. SIO1E1]
MFRRFYSTNGSIQFESIFLRLWPWATTAFVLEAGECEVTVRDERGREVVVARLTAPSAFGEVALLRNEPRSGSVRCVTDVVVRPIPAEHFASLETANPAVHLLSRQLAERMVERDTEVLRYRGEAERARF